jgi:hypothetical protein
MNTSALITMLSTIIIVTVITVYLFIKAYHAPKKAESDSYSDNDEIKR